MKRYRRRHAAVFATDPAGIIGSQKAFSRRASALRAKARDGELSAATMQDLAAPMSQILAREDRKERGND